MLADRPSVIALIKSNFLNLFDDGAGACRGVLIGLLCCLPFQLYAQQLDENNLPTQTVATDDVVATYNFDIPAQRLSTALLVFSQQAGIQVFYRSAIAQGQVSTAISGLLTVEEALTLLLGSSNLGYRYTDKQTIALFRAMANPVTEVLEPVRQEEVRVLGSLIRHSAQYDRSPPVSIIDRTSVAFDSGNDMASITQALPFNSGTEVRVNNLSQPLITGTAAVNIRNLGLGSTMVLVNGHRQTLSPVATNEGETFVDLHGVMPLIMMDRMEVLRGGASSTYGSDAVAGVINIIPRVDFDGLEVRAEYQQTGSADQTDYQFEIIFGQGFAAGDGHWVIAASLFNRGALATGDRDFARNSVISSSGQPGTYRGSTGLIRDPACGVSGGIVSDESEFCLFDASPYFDLVPEEKRSHLYSLLDFTLNDRHTLRWGMGGALADVKVHASPSFPFATSLPVVPVDNPGNLSNEPLLFQGRVLGADAGASASTSEYQNIHTYVEVESVFDQWSLSSMLALSENRARYGREDVVKDQFQGALNGEGGGSGNQVWNPLYQAENPDGLAQTFFADWGMRGKTQLSSLDVVARSDWRDWQSIAYAVALGAHYRYETLTNTFSEAFNNNQFYALGGGPDFSAHRDVASIYSEIYFSWDESLELQLAGRYEDYGRGVNAVAPMVAVLWRGSDWVSLRTSYSRAFKAASLFQVGADQSVPSPVFDSLNPDGARFRNVVTHGSDNLKPEQADVFNIGLSVSSWHGLSVDIDFWYYDYRDVILKESPQQIVDQALLGSEDAIKKIERDPVSGEILRIDADFINAASVETTGVDGTLKYQWQSHWGQWQLGSNWTWVKQFDIQTQEGGAVIDGVGSRNATTPAARSLPQWRAANFLQWQRSEHQLRMVVNYIDDYRDDKNDNAKIDSFTTVDLHYQTGLMRKFHGIELGVSVMNVLDREPPALDDFLGYDAKVHDPRGRVFVLSTRFPY